MADPNRRYREPPEAGVGGEGPITDQTGLGPTTDVEIAEAVRAALVLDPDVDHNHFTIDVADGVVRLAGQAGSRDERRRAVDVANHVSNVRRVVDLPAKE
ncbi:MAG: BON domain-containing protein [Chloroflexi bacterium]|nr:BON domain-containing protein [Chloroflexota bacterium]